MGENKQSHDQPELVTGTFVYGVAHGGKRHYDFEMRIPTMGDNIDATEQFPQGSAARLDLVMFAACMTKLGEIPEEDFTFELLCQLQPSDADVIYAQVAEAKKKLTRPSLDSESSERSSSFSDATESPRNVSVS
jgi:hypothetical protein